MFQSTLLERASGHMRQGYENWLRRQGYDAGTVTAQSYRTARVEQFYGDLEDHYRTDHLEAIINTLRYSTEDERHGRPNPSRIPFKGSCRSNLASYRNAVERYLRFLDSPVEVGKAGSDALTSPSRPLRRRRFAERRSLSLQMRRGPRRMNVLSG